MISAKVVCPAVYHSSSVSSSANSGIISTEASA
jgi:hypothetical protein